MSARKASSPRRKRPEALDSQRALQLRIWLSPRDTARLREFQADDEGPADAIRRLIRTAAMVQPIMDLLQQRQAGPAPVAQTPPTQDDAVQRQLDALTGWVEDD